MTLASLQFLVLATMLGIAVVTDLRERRIPNVVTVSGALVGLAIAGLMGSGIPGAALLGMLVALFTTLPFFALGVMGAGDVKLFAAVGVFVGVGGLLPVVIYSGIAGGIIGLVMSTRRGVLIPVLIQTKGVLLHTVTLGRRGDLRSIEDPDAQTIPYGVAIAAGTLAAWFWPLTVIGGLV